MPGSWRISLIVTTRTFSTSTLDPLDDLIESWDPESVRLNALVEPSKRTDGSSSAWRTPRLHPVNSSENTFWTVNSNCLKLLLLIS